MPHPYLACAPASAPTCPLRRLFCLESPPVIFSGSEASVCRTGARLQRYLGTFHIAQPWNERANLETWNQRNKFGSYRISTHLGRLKQSKTYLFYLPSLYYSYRTTTSSSKMDSSLSNFDLNRLTDSDKQELQQVLQSEAQKTQIQQSEFHKTSHPACRPSVPGLMYC